MIEYIGTYKKVSVFKADEKEYLSSYHTKPSNTYGLIGENLIQDGKKVASLINGYIYECAPSVEYELGRKMTGEPVKKNEMPIKEAVAQTFDVDEYLKMKKSVDYFFEELKKGT